MRKSVKTKNTVFLENFGVLRLRIETVESAPFHLFGGDLEVICRDIGGNEGKSGGKLWVVKCWILLNYFSNFKDLQNGFRRSPQLHQLFLKRSLSDFFFIEWIFLVWFLSLKLFARTKFRFCCLCFLFIAFRATGTKNNLRNERLYDRIIPRKIALI